MRVVGRGGKTLDATSSAAVIDQIRRGALVSEEDRLAEQLSERELAILDMIAEGMTNREIAERLYLSEKTVKHHVSDILGKLGVTRIDGAPLQGSGSAGLVRPAGAKGPAFLVFGNFNALYAYNNAESYALAISHLSDRLKGRPALATPWPTDDPGLSRRQRRALQELLIARGHDIGVADGRIGPMTISAIRKIQQELGMKPNGRPSSGSDVFGRRSMTNCPGRIAAAMSGQASRTR